MITVVNKYKHTSTNNDVYIGRGSAFGNPFSHLESEYIITKVETREEAIAAYKGWFVGEMADDDSVLKHKIEALPKDAILVCFCKPKECHGDVIAEYVNNIRNEK